MEWESDIIQELILRSGYEGFGIYTALKQYCSLRYLGGNDTQFKIKSWFLRGAFGFSTKKITNFMCLLNELNLIELIKSGEIFEINFPILLEIQDDYTKKYGQKTNKGPTEVRNKRIEEKEEREENSGHTSEPVVKISVKKQNKKPNPESQEVLIYLNGKTNRNLKVTTAANLKYINARLTQHQKSDLIKVIDYKCHEWLENPKMNKALNPKTLFRPENFERYLEESKGFEPGDGGKSLVGLFSNILAIGENDGKNSENHEERSSSTEYNREGKAL